ncbi:MAG: family 10 glycosylhydrolase [Cyanobacteriota bacterium]|nr:family 10 glycosylhydrolase [Cyanobacteriota bacterium]
MLRELRGVWIASHHHCSLWQDRRALARALDQVREIGANTVFAAVWNRGYTAWPSAVMERQGLPRQDPRYAQAGMDPLALVVELGRERGLKVIAWLEYGVAAEPVGAAGPLLAAKPEWAALDRRGEVVAHGGLRWLNGLDGRVREFVAALVEEVVERYGVDGVQLDDHLAIPLTGSHDPATLADFRRATGRSPGRRDDDHRWSLYRREVLAAWVAELGERIHSHRPGLLWCVSPAPLPSGRRQLMQDGARWLNEGRVDLVLPQLYRDSVGGFRRLLAANVRPVAVERRRQLVAGLALRVHGRELEEPVLREMVRLSRRAGLGGVAFFHHTPLLASGAASAQALWA